MSHHTFDHHPPCPGGCGELADECRCPKPNPFGSMAINRDADNVPVDALLRFRGAADAVVAERVRAHAKHSAKGQSAEQMPWTDPFWLPVLIEEVGEVARAICDRESAERVREELIQVAAMAEAWADAIEDAS